MLAYTGFSRVRSSGANQYSSCFPWLVLKRHVPYVLVESLWIWGGGSPMSPVWILKCLVSVFINACRLLTALPSLWQFGRGRLSLVARSFFYPLSLLFGPCRLSEFTLAGPLKWPCTIDTIKVPSVPCNFCITCSTCNSDWGRVSLAWVLVGVVPSP